jgi:aryl-alcohol dehydrogenase-like predicted oxidoreductase
VSTLAYILSVFQECAITGGDIKEVKVTLQNVGLGGGFRLGRKSLLAALRESLKRIGKERVDLYQVLEVMFLQLALIL